MKNSRHKILETRPIGQSIYKNKKGFSLIEAVITIFIIGVVLVLYQSAVSTIRLTKIAKDQEIALRVANNKIEELRTGGYANLPESGGFSDAQLSVLPSGSGNMEISNFNADTKQVLVEVEWQETGSSSARNVTLATLITKTGGM